MIPELVPVPPGPFAAAVGVLPYAAGIVVLYYLLTRLGSGRSRDRSGLLKLSAFGGLQLVALALIGSVESELTATSAVDVQATLTDLYYFVVVEILAVVLLMAATSDFHKSDKGFPRPLFLLVGLMEVLAGVIYLGGTAQAASAPGLLAQSVGADVLQSFLLLAAGIVTIALRYHRAIGGISRSGSRFLSLSLKVGGRMQFFFLLYFVFLFPAIFGAALQDLSTVVTFPFLATLQQYAQAFAGVQPLLLLLSVASLVLIIAGSLSAARRVGSLPASAPLEPTRPQSLPPTQQPRQVQPGPPQGDSLCSGCGTRIPAEESFCRNCGKKRDE